MKSGRAVMAAVCMTVLVSCTSTLQNRGRVEVGNEAGIRVTSFGQMPDGRTVHRYQLQNSAGMRAAIITYGATVVSLTAPDKAGNMGDVVLGYDSLDKYLKSGGFLGAVVGRFGNRISQGRFRLDGVTYELARNNGENHLHGGRKGFGKVLWDGTPLRNQDGVGVKLTYLSKDGEEGYPGNLKVSVTYMLTDAHELRIDYEATTDKPTPVNLTHHGYFNLTCGRQEVLAHKLMLNAEKFTPVDKGMIPTGKLVDTQGTPMDFRKETPIGAHIDADDEQLRFGHGYDHNWVLKRNGPGLILAARVYEPMSGRVMKVLTTEPGIQFYTGNWLNDVGKGGTPYKRRWGLCLETQHYPDSPNRPNFPSTILRPGETYRSTTIYQFSTR